MENVPDETQGKRGSELTLAGVAKRAGVSTATVSRVLNNSAPVRESTRKRVLQAADQLNYSPNLHAQTLAGGKSNTLGVIVSNLDNPFFLDIFRGAEEAAASEGYEVFVENTSYQPDRLTAAVRAQLSRRLAGLALVVSEIEGPLVQELSASNTPIAFVDIGPPRDNDIKIQIRYDRGMNRIIQYLYNLGHRRIAFVGRGPCAGRIQQRRDAFLQTSRQFPDIHHTLVSTADGLEGGRAAAGQLLLAHERPTAIVCANDFIALGVLQELREEGVAVPDEISVAGFDNIQLAEYVYPSLTTVNVPRNRIGQLVFEALIHGQEPETSGREFLVNTELVLRDSTAPVRRT